VIEAAPFSRSLNYKRNLFANTALCYGAELRVHCGAKPDQETIVKQALWLVLVSAGCSTTIHGVVRDKPTGNPLSSASLSVGDRNAVTSANGAYTLTVRVKPPSVLTVNAPGYFMYSSSVAKRPDESREIVRDVELVPRTAITPRQ